MGQRYTKLSEKHIQFIREQKMFFVGTATADSHVNLSPKGMDSLRVLGDAQVVWLNVTGSGNEMSIDGIPTHIVGKPLQHEKGSVQGSAGRWRP